MTNVTIQIRTDATVKEDANAIFAGLGITMSDGINIFLRQVQIHRGFPFDLRLGLPTEAENDRQTTEERLAHIRSLAGKYGGCAFSTKRLFEERQRDIESENAK